MRTNDSKRTRALRALLVLLSMLGMAAAAYGQTERPKTAAEYFSEGLRLQRTGENEKAADAYRAALRLDPKHFGACVNLGFTLMTLGKYEDAASAFKDAAAISPQ